MPHPSEAVLIAFADEELDAGTRRDVSAHMDGCGRCRHALRDLRDAMGSLKVETALVDASEPATWCTGPIAPARAVAFRESFERTDIQPSRSVPGSRDRRPTTIRRSIVSMRWAALFLVLAGGAAAAMTAPRWRAFFVEPEREVPSARLPSIPASATHVSAVPTASAAVSVLPVEGEAVVSLLSAPLASDTRVIVRVSDRRDVQVTVTSPTNAQRVPRFLTGDGRLEVQLAGEGSVVEVEFPVALRSARVTHDGRAVVTVHGSSILPALAATEGVALRAERE